jgi:hypothetical protein
MGVWMPRDIGETQKKIGFCLLEHKGLGIDARDLARRIYKVEDPSRSHMNVVWAALKGLNQRKIIVHAGTSLEGFRQWILTGEGRAAFEALKRPAKLRAVK